MIIIPWLHRWRLIVTKYHRLCLYQFDLHIYSLSLIMNILLIYKYNKLYIYIYIYIYIYLCLWMLNFLVVFIQIWTDTIIIQSSKCYVKWKASGLYTIPQCRIEFLNLTWGLFAMFYYQIFDQVPIIYLKKNKILFNLTIHSKF